MFLRNQWYVAAFDDELGRTPLARTVLGEELILFRRLDGGAVALENRCAHRRLPLSAGRLVGDTIECGYHGLVYDCGGRCIKIPGQVHGPEAPVVRAYPVVERHRFVYVWIGDAELADPARIVSFPRLSDPASGVTKVRLHVPANHLLILDNLLDLSHIAYVHNSTIGNAAVAEQAEVKTRRIGQHVRVTREMNGVPAPSTYAQFGPHQGIFDRWQLSEFRPPGYFWINNGSAACGWRSADGGDRIETQGEWGFEVYHGITPETATTTHQFWTLAHALDMVRPDDRAEFYRQCHHVVYEDLAVYEAQQRSLDTDPAGASADAVGSRIAIEADRALLQGRQVLKELMRANHPTQPPIPHEARP
ncbi:MAG TPA: aromatic ring-hydroxylating dioxygenase subunit alpha [Candidatus Sulfotelmatobacter sp.]|nr:aromatic ring-hydroxylating dioxygenase subunit alpha [Candidatus Sulfotelmatobacter sp.]